MMATYGMKNVEIRKSTHNTYLVYADTARFGKHEIMYESHDRNDCVAWLKDNGVEIDKTPMEMLEEQIAAPCGRIQIGNAMYRRIHRDGDKIYGYSKTNGMTELNRFFKEAVTTGENTATTTSGMTYGWQKKLTIKFGNACTW